jgi:4-hydroxythreonine-4-phosphate dehydrogenase
MLEFSTTRRPRIAITMGDPAGVGPELCLKLLNEPSITQICTLLVFGDAAVLAACAGKLGLPLATKIISANDTLAVVNEPSIIDFKAIALDQFTPGAINAATGAASYLYINRAIDAALAGDVDAVTTLPINKEALSLAGINFPGHTEIFASRTSAERSCMMQYSEEITCTFVTTHVGYHEVTKFMTRARILDVIRLTNDALLSIRGRQPKLLVCGLNPHAGEHGLFGEREEERIIAPAIDAARAEGISLEGPLPPDTAFIASKRKSTDAVVCMYHDQGHIPVKALAFDSAVNTTLGLPIIRTSVDHGTALDIAWRGEAGTGSLYAAVRLAVKLASDAC